jgi:hypothetical protein
MIACREVDAFFKERSEAREMEIKELMRGVA